MPNELNIVSTLITKAILRSSILKILKVLVEELIFRGLLFLNCTLYFITFCHKIKINELDKNENILQLFGFWDTFFER